MVQDIDVLVLGSSRIRSAVNPFELAEALEGKTVVNFGQVGLSVIRSYLLLRETYAQGQKPEIVILDAAIDELRSIYDDKDNIREDWILRPETASMFQLSDFFSLPLLVSDYGLLGWTSHIGNGLLTKIQSAVEKVASYRIRHQYGIGLKSSSHWCQRIITESKQEIDAKLQNGLAVIQSEFEHEIPDLDDRFIPGTGSFHSTEIYYINQIRNLVQRNSGRLIVVRPMINGRPPLSEFAVNQLKSIVPEFWSLPVDLVHKLENRYVDPTHHDTEGATLFTNWLALVVEAEVTSNDSQP